MTLDVHGLRRLAAAFSAVVLIGLFAMLLAVTEAAAGATITLATSMPKAAVGRAYNQGTAPFVNAFVYNPKYTLTSGELPPGLTLGSTDFGAVSGTPTSTGSWTYTVSVEDTRPSDKGDPTSATYTLVVGTPVSVDTTAIPSGTVGVPYSFQLAASGGDKPYSFSQSLGSLPAGLTVSSDGIISGTPTTVGTTNPWFFVTDANYPEAVLTTRDYWGVAKGPLTMSIVAAVAPTVSSVTPNLGSSAGGTSVTITGTDLAGATAVSFGGTAAASFNVDSATQITAVTPAHAAGAVAVMVTTAGGSDTKTGGFTFEAAAPTVSSVTPDLGSTAGGTSVTITGTNLTGATAVSFGGTAAASFNVDSATQITAVTPAHAAGAVDVVVTTAGGSDTRAGGFTFETPAPTVSSVTPDLGSTAGGTSVTITGTDLTGATAVSFGGTAAASFNVDSATQITAVTPAHAAGAVDVVVTTAGGSDTKAGGFTFETPAATDATLSGFSLSAGTLDPAFAANVFVYSLEVGYEIDAITVTSTVSDKNASVRVNGTLVTSGTASPPITLGVGTDQISITVTAEDGTTTQTYTVTINRGRPDPALDPDVVGLLDAQASAARRFARTQTQNFNTRLEHLHQDGGRGLSSMDVSISYAPSTSGSTAESQIDQMIATSHDVDAYPAQAVDAGALAYAPAAEGQPSFPTVAEPDLGPLAVWSGGFVDFGERDGGGLDLDHTTVGVSGGVDYRFSDDLVAGLGVGYGFDRTDIGVNGTENAARAYSAALYGSYSPTAGLFIDGLFGGSLMDHDSTRYVAANGEFATGSRSGTQIFGSLTTAYEFRDENWLVSPYGRVEFSRSWLDGFTEAGGGAYALTYGDQMTDTFSGVLGIRANYAVETDWGTLTPGIRAEYTNDFQGTSLASLGYADLGDLTDVIDVDPDAGNRATLGLSLDFQFENEMTLSLDYSASFGASGSQDHVLGAKIGLMF